MRVRLLAVLCAVACAGLTFGAGAAAAKTTDAEVLVGLEGLVAAPEGPPGRSRRSTATAS